MTSVTILFKLKQRNLVKTSTRVYAAVVAFVLTAPGSHGDKDTCVAKLIPFLLA